MIAPRFVRIGYEKYINPISPPVLSTPRSNNSSETRNFNKMSFATYEARSKYHPTAVGRALLEIMASKKSNLALSADVTDTKSLLALVDGINPDGGLEADPN
jgi:hypothetical protein